MYLYYSPPYGAYGEILNDWPSLRLSESSPAQTWVEPLTTAQVRKAVNIEYGSTTDDDQEQEFTDMIVAARQQAEYFQNRDLVRKQWDMTRDYFDAYRIGLRDPLISVDLVRYTKSDATTADLVVGTDYFVDKARASPCIAPAYNTRWPAYSAQPSSSVLIRFTSGYSIVDDSSGWWNGPGAVVKRGMLALIQHWFDNRLPFTRGIGNVEEYPLTVTDLLSWGAKNRNKL